MAKKQKKISLISKGNIISVIIVCGVLVLIAYFALQSFKPVNSDQFVFEPTTNIFLKAVNSPQGYHYASQSTKGGKVLPSVAGSSPTITVSKGNLVQIHLINEEKNPPGGYSKHNLHIDEFNVHFKDLGYFQTESIIFLADKTGTFEYYSSIHPEMRGIIEVIQN